MDELKQQALADKTLLEPARHLADEMTRAGQPVFLDRFSYVAELERYKLKGTMHGFEIPYTFDIPAALVATRSPIPDKAMGVGERLLAGWPDKQIEWRRPPVMAAP